MICISIYDKVWTMKNRILLFLTLLSPLIISCANADSIPMLESTSYISMETTTVSNPPMNSSTIEESITSLPSTSCSITSQQEDPATRFDFSPQCMTHLNYIGTNLTDRDINGVSNNDHNDAKAYIQNVLANAGYSNVFEQSFTYRRKSAANVVCRIAGISHTKRVVLGAHYDGDGVGDNGSGIALLLGVAEGIAGITPYYDLDIVFFDCEEVGEYGSIAYVNALEDPSAIAFMINIDSIAFGDYPNIYGGNQSSSGNITQLEAYNLAVAKAINLGFNMWDSDDLDGYFALHGTGPEIAENTFYTNPWTKNHDSPNHLRVYSPTTLDASDHVPFKDAGIPIVYFEATNWFSAGDGGYDAYSGYFEVYDTTIGDHGMFMNTQYDTLANLNAYFPGRAEQHFHIYSSLLSSLVLYPNTNEAAPQNDH